MKLSISFCVVVLSVFMSELYAQQDAHYTQYMYNTMSVNPAYAGSRGYGFMSVLARNQWVKFVDAPKTQNISFDAPVGRGIGLGLNIYNDALGPIKELHLECNVSYTIEAKDDKKLAFGLRLGRRTLDWNIGDYYQEGDPIYNTNDSKILPVIGSGVYYYRPEKWYVGLSVPNLLRNESHSQDALNIDIASADKMHLYMILGRVFSIKNIKFKAASLIKAVSGSPLSVDLSGNFYFYEKANVGVSWRWEDSISASLGFSVTDSFLIGYAYDLTTSNYRVSNVGSHELILQYQFFGVGGPRSLKCF